MFSGQLPHYLEPRKLARRGGEVSGQTTVAALSRLAEFRDSQDSVVHVRLCFEQDQDGHFCVHGEVSTVLHMQCQRCLETVAREVRALPHLAVVWSEDQVSALPRYLDPWLVSDERMPLAELLEEELLLALPLVAMHEECPRPLHNPAALEDEDMRAEGPAADADNPFAVLERLKSRKNRKKAPREN